MKRLLCGQASATTIFGSDVFGNSAQILAHGKATRFFTPAQQRALAARDGGCVWPGCPQPPAQCEAHHVTEWQHPDHAPGVTDTDNGVLLCRFHHANIHNSRCKITMRGGVPYLRPPREQRWWITERRMRSIATGNMSSRVVLVSAEPAVKQACFSAEINAPTTERNGKRPLGTARNSAAETQAMIPTDWVKPNT